MPKPNHTKVTFSGIFGTVAAPIETWSWSLSASEVVFANTADRVAVAQAMVTAYQNNLQGAFRSHVVLTRVRVAQVGALGLVTKSPAGSYNQGDADTVSAGTSTSAASVVYPLQTALCVSLDTDRSGPSGKGRAFLPPPAMALNGVSFTLPEGEIGALATAFATMIQQVDAAIDRGQPVAGTKVSVVSSKGFMSPVTSVRVGRVLDTMRSRRGDLAEGYVTAPVNQ